LREGTDLKYGARHLKRAIERHVVYPIANLLATDQVTIGDVLSIDWDGTANHLSFLKEAEGALIPMSSPEPGLLADAAAAISDGRSISAAPNAMAAEAKSDQQLSPMVHRGVISDRSKHEKK
ncbi:MAG TPA: hypothetical protein VMJ93_15415, partial [Verrucomicrobiae bacterium]|nr:hypothetical protein [Verrucomicrobiae bacterium]